LSCLDPLDRAPKRYRDIRVRHQRMTRTFDHDKDLWILRSSSVLIVVHRELEAANCRIAKLDNYNCVRLQPVSTAVPIIAKHPLSPSCWSVNSCRTSEIRSSPTETILFFAWRDREWNLLSKQWTFDCRSYSVSSFTFLSTSVGCAPYSP
jgi:hypothetical protein